MAIDQTLKLCVCYCGVTTQRGVAGEARTRPRAATMASLAGSPGGTLNINIGVMGHVDSGKTSLVKTLSTMLSTAALDKHKQSQERGITLDLGFSSFSTDVPEHLKGSGVSRLQFTLVDCPGHASLIRTIIGGAQIIDMMILVVDITKGIQTQTAECIVIGEICCAPEDVIIVLNKVDLIDEAVRDAKIAKAKAQLSKVFSKTVFRDAPMITVSAVVGEKKWLPWGEQSKSKSISSRRLPEETGRVHQQRGPASAAATANGTVSVATAAGIKTIASTASSARSNLACACRSGIRTGTCCSLSTTASLSVARVPCLPAQFCEAP